MARRNEFFASRKEEKQEQSGKAKPRLAAKELRQQVQTAAYYRFIKRGGRPGSELADWFEAEKEIKQRYELV